MSEHTPEPRPEDGATQPVEYLGDAPAPPEQRPRRGRRALVGVTLGALLAAGAAGAFAVAQFLDGGPQAATAAPADTMAWLQVDLDPSGGQKLAAYRTLKKFPALEEELGLTSQDDLRRWAFEGLTSDSGCDEVGFADTQPWLGSALGFGAVPGKGGGAEGPTVFFALEVTDQAAAVPGVRALAECLGEDQVGTAFVGDFMVVAETDGEARDIAASAEESSLADDATYSARTSAAGDDGILTGYLSPGFGDYMADQLGSLGGMFSEGSSAGSSEGSSGGGGSMLAGRAGALTEDTSVPGAAPSASATDLPSDVPTELMSDLPSDFPTELLTEMPSDFPSDLQRHGGEDDLGGMDPMPMPGMTGPGMLLGGLSPLGGTGGLDQLADQLADFGGAAMQVRFADESLEVEVSSPGLSGEVAGSGTVDLGDLPTGTGLALGAATGESWAQQLVESLRSSDPQGFDDDMAEASRETGLSLPEDLPTLVGDSVVVAVDSSLDLPRLFESFLFGPAPDHLEAGLRITGDPDEIAPLLQKLADRAGSTDGPQVVVARGEDAAAIGFDQDYVSRLADGGDLGGAGSFERALPDSGDALGAIFADFDAGGWLDRAMEDSSADDRANAEPLSALGVTMQRDGDAVHLTMRLTTD